MFKINTNLKNIKFKIWKSKGLIFIALVAIFLFCVSIFKAQETQAEKNKEVLGVRSKAVLNVPSPTQRPTPSITPTLAPRVNLNLPSIPSLTPTVTRIPIPTQANNSNSSASNTAASTPSPTQTPTPTVTLTPTPIPAQEGLNVQLGIDYTEGKSADSYSVVVNPGQSAWDAVVAAIGIDNIKYTDYGGDLGKFITSFNGIEADSNQYYEFRINGVLSNVGVSSYQCNQGDKLDFVLTNF